MDVVVVGKGRWTRIGKRRWCKRPRSFLKLPLPSFPSPSNLLLAQIRDKLRSQPRWLIGKLSQGGLWEYVCEREEWAGFYLRTAAAVRTHEQVLFSTLSVHPNFSGLFSCLLCEMSSQTTLSKCRPIDDLALRSRGWRSWTFDWMVSGQNIFPFLCYLSSPPQGN